MPAVVKVDRVGVPEVGQYTDGCPPQVVAGRIVFAQLIPGVERASDAVPVVVGALSGVFDAGGGDGSVRVANNASIAFDRPIHDLGASAVSRSMSDCGVPAWRESAELADAAPFYRQWQPVRHLSTVTTLIPHFVISFGPTVAKTR